MKRTISLILALIFALMLAPGVLADVLWIPDDPFLNSHDCSQHDRSYYAAGPDGQVVVYESPASNVVVKKLPNGELIGISWDYTDENGNVWGFCEHWDEETYDTDWTGWMPLDHLLLKYDSISFREEFAQRIKAQEGELKVSGAEVRFWDYPGSEDAIVLTLEGDYYPGYDAVFTDDAGRVWGNVPYHMGIRSTWVCVSAPTADYETLYAEDPPQQVNHPVQEGTPAEIKPGGMDLRLVLLAVSALALASGGFLLVTRKKK